MFISEETAQERIRSSQNILNRVKRDDEPIELGDLPLPAAVPAVSEDGEVSTDPKVEVLPPESSDDVLSPNGLDKLLRGDEETIARKRRKRTLEETAAIGLTAQLISAHAAGRMNGLGHMQANNIEHGYTSTRDRMNPNKTPKQELQEKILELNGKVVDKAFDRLLRAIDLMDDEKLAKIMKPEVLSRIAGDMHRIVTNSTPKDAEDAAQGVHFHIYRPEVREESDYEVVRIGGGAQ